jgi:Phosphoserine phosphatase RsbU, N-terminal domain
VPAATPTRDRPTAASYRKAPVVTLSGAAFRSVYAARLAEYVEDQGEAGLHSAYELGREVVARDLSILEVAGVHHDTLDQLCRTAATGEIPGLVRAAGDFFLDLLSAYEMDRRGLHEVRAAALAERRSSAMLRRLSSFLADPLLAAESKSSAEALKLVAEEARELTRASTCIVTAELHPGRPIRAVAGSGLPAAMIESAALDRRRQLMTAGAAAVRIARRDAAVEESPAIGAETGPWLAASLRYLNGAEFGAIELFGREQGDFGDLDVAFLVHLAELVSAAFERASLHRQANGSS